MTLNEVMDALEEAGTEQNRKVYSKHGVNPPLFGVSFAELGRLTKRIKCDHQLARALWAAGNYDGRVLATMIADPQQMTSAELDRWVKDLDDYCLTDQFAGLAAKSPHAGAKADKWRNAKGEWVASAGWRIVAHQAMNDGSLPDSHFEEILRTIERDIHSSKNRVRHEMNGVVIGIGIRSPKLTRIAIAAAKRIGRVVVDHGQTGCKTPDAAAYIKKVLDRKAARAARA